MLKLQHNDADQHLKIRRVPRVVSKIEWKRKQRKNSGGGKSQYFFKTVRRLQALRQFQPNALGFSERSAQKATTTQDCLSNTQQICCQVDTQLGRQKVFDYLKTIPFPHYEAVPGFPDQLIQIDEHGNRVRGRFVGRTFQRLDG